jgi:hypothetical protein
MLRGREQVGIIEGSKPYSTTYLVCQKILRPKGTYLPRYVSTRKSVLWEQKGIGGSSTGSSRKPNWTRLGARAVGF